MRLPFATLTLAEIERFERDGFVVVKEAFARADARAMEARWWEELEAAHGISRDDRASWREIPGDLKAAKRDPIQARILSDRVRGVLDDLLGAGAWLTPKDWGRTIVTFPEPGEWDVPGWFWHWDSPTAVHLDRPTALFVVSMIGPVAPRGGGTLVLAGSHRLLLDQHERVADQPGTRPWERFYRLHPWLMALAGEAPSPADRVAAFMDCETLAEGVPLRVVELTGEPGDMVFCHPCLVHCGASNRGEWPRMMRIRQQVLTAEGQERRRAFDRFAGAV